MAKISVVLPIYNVGKYLEKCLESIQNQTFKDFEAICVDDCGTDNSIEIAQRFIEKDSRFKLVRHEHNRGLSAARNTGIDIATGEYIVFIDSDDWVEPTLLEKILEGFKEAKTDSVWFNAYVHENATGQTSFLANNLATNSTIKLDANNLANFPNYSWNKAFKLSKLKETNVRFTEGLYFEDSDFYYRIFTKITEIFLIQQPLYHYQLRENSIVTGNQNAEKKYEDLFQITINLYHFFKENNIFEQNKKILLEYFTQIIIPVKIEKRRKQITQLAKKVLKEIDFPNSYTDLKL